MAKQLLLEVAQLTDVGRKREHNEDNMAYVIPPDAEVMAKKGALFIVADGMGGHAAGEVASEIAVDTVSTAYYEEASDDIPLSLEHAIKRANASIHQRAAENMLRSGMGTTCVAAVLCADMAYIANVGDSRAYLVRGGNVRQLSQDHSWVAEQVRAGLLTEDQARVHAQRNVITRCLGTQTDVEIDIFTELLEKDDSLVLCTDGLSGLVSDDDLRRIVSQFVPRESVYHLVERANENGGPDNITAIVVHVQEVGSEPNGRRPAYVGVRETSEDGSTSRSITTVPLTLAPQTTDKRSGPLRISGPLIPVPDSADTEPITKAPRRGRNRLLYPTVALLILLLLALLGGGGYYLAGTQSVQHIQALISQAQSNVRSNPTQALQQLASAQNMLQALPGDPLLTTQRSQLSQELTTTVQQAIGSYNQHAAITPLSCPAVPINDGSTGTHSQRLALVQASTGPVLYALGQDRQLYQLNSQDSLTAPLAFGNPIVDIASDETRLVVLLKATPGNDYVLGLALPGQSHLGQVAAINPSGLVNGEVPTLLAAQGADIYVVLASPAASSSTTQHTQVFAFSVDASNGLKTNPTRTPFALPAKIVSVTAFPGHLLFFLLADGSVESVQLPSKGPAPQATPVLLPAPLAAPLALSETAFRTTTPVPVPTTATALTATGPVPLQVSPSGALAADVVAGMPQLYLADMAQHRVLDLVNAATGGGVAGTSSVTLQVVQQYVSPTLVGPMTSLTVNAKGVLHVLTQNTSNPSTVSLVSINAANEQNPANCA